MSTGSGNSSTGDSRNNGNNTAGKASFTTLNINNLYRGKSLEQSKTPAPKHGMQTIGKLGNIRRLPNPSSSSSCSLSTLTLTKTSVKDLKVSDPSSCNSGGGNSCTNTSSSSSSWNQSGNNGSNNSLSKPGLTGVGGPVGRQGPVGPQGQAPWTGSTPLNTAFPVLGAEPVKRVDGVKNQNQNKSILPSTEFPELGTTLEEVKEKSKPPDVGSTAPPVSLPSHPNSAVVSDASYGPGPALRPPPLNWNQRTNIATPSLGINGSGPGGGPPMDGRPFHSFAVNNNPPQTAFGRGGVGVGAVSSTTIGSQFAAQRSGFHGGGVPNQGVVGKSEYLGSRPKAKEELPSKFKASIIPSEKITEFDEILEKGEMKIDWTSACDDIDYDQDLNFDLDETSTKKTPKKEEPSQQPAKVANRHPSFEDEFTRGQSNPSARVLFDPRDGKQKPLSNMPRGDGIQRTRKDSRSLSDKSDDGAPQGRPVRPGPGGDTRPSQPLISKPTQKDPRGSSQGPQSQLTPRFQKQNQGQQLPSQFDSNRSRPEQQQRSGMTSLGPPRQKPIHDMRSQQQPEPTPVVDNTRRPRSDSQTNAMPLKETCGWKSKGEELSWRSQAKRVDTNKPTEVRKETNIVILRHESVKVIENEKIHDSIEHEKDLSRHSRTQESGRELNSQSQIQSQNLSSVRSHPPAPPGIKVAQLNQQPTRPSDNYWRGSNNESKDEPNRHHDQSRHEVRQTDSLDNKRHIIPPRNEDKNVDSQSMTDRKDDPRCLEKRLEAMSMNQQNVTSAPFLRPGQVQDEAKTARLPGQPYLNVGSSEGKKELPGVAMGPAMARVLAGSTYGPPPKPAFGSSRSLTQSSSLEHQDSGVDVDHPPSAASSQRSSPGNVENKSKLILPANTSLIGKSVEESAETPMGTVIYENRNFREQNATLEKGRKPTNENPNDYRRIQKVTDQPRTGFAIKGMDHPSSSREQDLDQKIASVRKVWDDTTPPPQSDGKINADGRPINSGQSPTVAALRGLVNDSMRQNQQQQYRRPSSGQMASASCSSPPVHVTQATHPQHANNHMFQQQQQMPTINQANLASMAADLAAVNHHHATSQYGPQLQAFAHLLQINQQQMRAQQSFAGMVPPMTASAIPDMHRINSGPLGHHEVNPPPGHALAPGAQLVKQPQPFMQNPAHFGYFSQPPQIQHNNYFPSGPGSPMGLPPDQQQPQQAGQYRPMMPISRSFRHD